MNPDICCLKYAYAGVLNIVQDCRKKMIDDKRKGYTMTRLLLFIISYGSFLLILTPRVFSYIVAAFVVFVCGTCAAVYKKIRGANLKKNNSLFYIFNNVNGYYSLEKGCYLPFEAADGEERQWLDTYEALQYNGIFDKKNQNKVFFPTVN